MLRSHAYPFVSTSQPALLTTSRPSSSRRGEEHERARRAESRVLLQWPSTSGANQSGSTNASGFTERDVVDAREIAHGEVVGRKSGIAQRPDHPHHREQGGHTIGRAVRRCIVDQHDLEPAGGPARVEDRCNRSLHHLAAVVVEDDHPYPRRHRQRTSVIPPRTHGCWPKLPRCRPQQPPTSRRPPTCRRSRTATDCPRWLIAAVVATGVALRWFVLASPLGGLDSDEAVSALVSREISHGRFPALIPGLRAGGTLLAYPRALVLALTGQSSLAAKLCEVAVFAAACVVVWRVGRRMFSERHGQIAALLMWIYPAATVWDSTKVRLYYTVALLLVALGMLFALRLYERPDSARMSRRSARSAGCACGHIRWRCTRSHQRSCGCSSADRP